MDLSAPGPAPAAALTHVQTEKAAHGDNPLPWWFGEWWMSLPCACGNQYLISHPNKEALCSGCTPQLRCSLHFSLQTRGTGTKPLIHRWGDTCSLGVQRVHFHKNPVEYLLWHCLSIFSFFPGKLNVNSISFDARLLGFAPTVFMLLRESWLHRQIAFEKLQLKPHTPAADCWKAFRKALSYSVGNNESDLLALERWLGTLERRRSWCVSYYPESALSLRRFNDKSMFTQNTDLQEWDEVTKKVKITKTYY